MRIIESDTLIVSVSDKGAELQSIFCKKNKIEYLWQGVAPFWQGKAPILFPIIGGLKDGGYRYNGETYAMAKHGFARTSVFRCTEAIQNQLVFELGTDAQVLASYPFIFDLRVIFTLDAASLHVEYLVTNRGDCDMLFNIGGHEAFRCPRADEESFEDYYLEFDPSDHDFISTAVTSDGLLSGQKFSVDAPKGRLTLSYESFKDIDTFIFEDIKSKKVALKSAKSPNYIEVVFDAPHLGIWTQADKGRAPFVCIEPWYGLPDEADATGNIEDKRGIMKLPVGKSKSFCHTISVKEDML